jgi:hypothetical protein
MASSHSLKWLADFNSHNAPIKCICIDSKLDRFSSLDEKGLRHWDLDGTITQSLSNASIFLPAFDLLPSLTPSACTHPRLDLPLYITPSALIYHPLAPPIGR